MKTPSVADPVNDPVQAFSLLSGEPAGGYQGGLIDCDTLPAGVTRLSEARSDVFLRCFHEATQISAETLTTANIAASAIAATALGARGYQPLFIESVGDETLILQDGSSLALIVGPGGARFLSRENHASQPMPDLVASALRTCLATADAYRDPLEAFTLLAMSGDAAPDLATNVSPLPAADVSIAVTRLEPIRTELSKDPYSTMRPPVDTIYVLLTHDAAPLLTQTIGPRTIYVRRGFGMALMIDNETSAAGLVRRTQESGVGGDELSPDLGLIVAPLFAR